MAKTAEDQVPLDREKLTDLEVIHPQLALAVLKDPFNGPARKSHSQKHLHMGALWGIAYEILQLCMVQGISGYQQMVRPTRQAVFIGQIHHHALGLPEHRTFAAVFDVIILPVVTPHARRIAQNIPYFNPRVVFDFQPRVLSMSSTLSVTSVSTVQYSRPLRPGGKIDRHFGNIILAQTVQGAQKRWFTAIILIESQPGEPQSVGHGSVVLLQGDLPLGAVDNLIGDAGFLASNPVVVPGCFGQIQFAINKGVEIRRGVAQVNTDHTVFSLAHSTAVLPLYAGRFVALFDKAGFVDGPDAVLVGVPTRDVVLEAIPHRSLVPAKQTKELLQVAWWFASSVRHGLDAFAWQIAQLALDVEIKVATGRDPSKAVVKLVQKASQFRFDPQNYVCIHADDLQKTSSFTTCHRLVA